MRIAVYILDAMISGVSTFAFDLAHGFREAGHEVTTVTSTKSGKETVRWSRIDGGARWWRQAPDVTCTHADLAAVLDTYDLVIMSDVAASTLDNEKTPPGYLTGFRETRTPWIPIAHGNCYDEAHAPHFRDLIENARRFTGVVLACTAPYSYDEHWAFRDLMCIPIKRPYVSRLAIDAKIPRNYTVGSVGRFSNGKNLHLMGLAWPFMNIPVVELWGATVNMIRPSDPYLVYEMLQKRDDVEVVTEPESKNKTAMWALQRKDQSSMLLYGGSYTDPIWTLQRMRVFVNLTSASFSAGTEYTTMEAIDAGCLVLAPNGLIDPGSQFSIGLLEPIEIPRTVVRGAKEVKLLETIASRCTGAMDVDETTHKHLAQWNREVLRREHDPKAIATGIIDRIIGRGQYA